MHSRSLFRIESTAGTGRGRREEGPGPHKFLLPRERRQQELLMQQQQQQQQAAAKREGRGEGDSEETQDEQVEEAGETGVEESAPPAGAVQAQQAGRVPQARAPSLEGLLASEQQGQGQQAGGLQAGQQEFSFGRSGMGAAGSGRVLEKQESSVQAAPARRGSMPPPPHFARPMQSPPRWAEEDEGAVRGGSTPQQQARRAGAGMAAAPLAVRPKATVGRRPHEQLSPQEDARSPPRHDGSARRGGGGREADVIAAGHERMEAQLRRARMQRITSMETDSSAPIMLHHVGSEQHLEDAQLTVPLKPDQLPPQLAQRSGSRDVKDEDEQPGEGKGRAAAAAAPAGPPAKLQPTQSALARAAAAELADGVEVAVAAAGSTGAPEALALIQQLNQLKQQVIQHLLASGHVMPDVKQEQQEEGGERPAGRQQQQQQQQQQQDGEGEERGSGKCRASESTPSKGQATDSKQQQPGRGAGSQSLAAQASSGGSGGEGPPLGEPNRSVTSLMQALGMSAPSHGTAAASPSQAPCSSMEVEKRESHPASSGAVMSAQQPAAESSGGASGGELRFRVTDYTPDWDFTAGGAKVIITGALSGEAAAGCSPTFSIRFGSEVVPATTVFPGVLRCTVPPTAAPGRVPLVILGPDNEPASEPVVFEYRPAMQQDGSGGMSAGGPLPAAELADRELQMRLIQTLLGYRGGSGALDAVLPSPVSQLGSVGPSRNGSGGWAAADSSARAASGSFEPHPLPQQQQQGQQEQQQEPMAGVEQLQDKGSGRLGPRGGGGGGSLDEGSNNLTRSAVAALVGGGGPGGSTQQDLLAAAMDRLPTAQREEMLQLLIQREVAELGATAGGSGAMECDNDSAEGEGEGGSRGAGGSSGAAAGAASRGINSLGVGGQALIHTFAGLGYDWAISVLGAAGADVNLVDAAGLTPLHWAAARGHEAAVGELLARGADPTRLSPATPSASAKLPADLAADNGHPGMAAYLAEAALSWAWNRMQQGGSGSVSGGGSGPQQGYVSATAGRKRSRPGLGGSGGRGGGGLGGLQGGMEGGDFALNAAASAKNVAAAIEDRYRQQQSDGGSEQQGMASEQGPPGRAGSQDVFGLLGQAPAGAHPSEYQQRLGTTVGHVDAMLNSGPARGQYMRMKQAGSAAVGQKPPIALSPFDQRAAAAVPQQRQGGVPVSSRLKYARTNTKQAQVPFEWRCFSGDFSDVVAQRDQQQGQQEQER